MPRFDTRPSYVVLRLDRGAAEWVAAASTRRRTAPDPIRTLLTGRSRVEVTEAEAEIALQWASELPGWDEDGRPPLFVHAPGASLVCG
jgi:hypothetical protein